MQGALRLFRARWRALLAACSLLALSAPVTPVHAATTGATQTYVVLYKTASSSKNAGSVIQAAGGQLVFNYQQIGVVIARSERSDFASRIASAPGVEGASATTRFATRLEPDQVEGTTSATVAQDIPAGGDSLSGLQWDMAQIHAFEAHAIQSGNPSVTAGDIDTGIDFTHPDLAQNVDYANSAGCVTGAPNNSPAAWLDDNGHGTHTAGTIAAANNGFGIVGVAPNVKIAAIKAGDAAGFFFPQAVICAFMWAGTHPAITVTNNSYFADPWLFNCKNDPGQRAIWKAEQRAIRFAMQNGVSVVAAEGNQSDDLAHPTQDATSPDDTTPVTRDITNACVVIPVEISGVIGVTADGNLQIKSFYSSYGVGSVQVVAPGGDSILQHTAAAPNGRVLSTYPSSQPCSRQVTEPVPGTGGVATYCYLQGTSMASPHVAGLVALLNSMGIRNPGQVQAHIDNSADPIACPDAATLALYAPFPAVDGGAPQQCQGGTGYNSWYGHGQINALSAVS
jgi:lantibiotic leader peptide-processing serine protease